MRILAIILIYILNVSANDLLQNSGVIDIGRTSTSSDIEVPQQFIFTEPILTQVDNLITYQNRVQSPLFDCETDFLGTESCPVDIEVCPSFEEYDDGYSQAHHILKTYEKMCPPNTIKIDDECFVDGNGDGLKDIFRDYSKFKEDYGRFVTGAWNMAEWYRVDNDSEMGGYLVKIEKTETGSTNITVPKDSITYFEFWSGDNSKSAKQYNQGWLSIDDTSIIDYPKTYTNGPSNNMFASYEYESDKEQEIEVKWENLGSYDPGSSKRRAWFQAYTVKCNSGIPTKYDNDVICWNSCPSGYSTDDYVYCKTPSKCPFGTTEQADGSCKMEYDWYSYHCDESQNTYDNRWNIVNEGADCGYPSCTNSATPPHNNCVRLDYTCPLNPDAKCGKTIVDDIECDDGFLWQSNRCEREEPYCGDYTYNASNDRCEEITEYIKNCRESADIFNDDINLCESKKSICSIGDFDREHAVCYDKFNGSCFSENYEYDSVAEMCFNKNEELCKDSYNYNTNKGLCMGEMAVCETGKVWNETTKKCEQDKCTELNTSDNNNRCETSVQCDGTVTSSGTCIPSKVQ